jgi:hypothetical protein
MCGVFGCGGCVLVIVGLLGLGCSGRVSGVVLVWVCVGVSIVSGVLLC